MHKNLKSNKSISFSFGKTLIFMKHCVLSICVTSWVSLELLYHLSWFLKLAYGTQANKIAIVNSHLESSENKHQQTVPLLATGLNNTGLLFMQF